MARSRPKRAPFKPSCPRAMSPIRAASLRAKACAVARPRPAEAPVITITLWFLLLFMVLPFFGAIGAVSGCGHFADSANIFDVRE